MHKDPTTGELLPGIAKVRYSHDAMIDAIVADPTIKQNDLAVLFDRTPAWISQVVNSDAFQARLEARREALIDPVLRTTIKERLSAVAAVSLEKILDRLSSPVTPSEDFLLKSAALTTKALGYGAREVGSQTNVAVVVQVPQKSASTTDWVNNHVPRE